MIVDWWGLLTKKVGPTAVFGSRENSSSIERWRLSRKSKECQSIRCWSSLFRASDRLGFAFDVWVPAVFLLVNKMCR